MPQTSQTYTNDVLRPVIDPDSALVQAVAFAPNLTLAKGIGVAQLTTTGKYVAYDTAGSNGAAICLGILKQAIKTDANGQVVYGTEATGEHGEKYGYAEIYVRGYFKRSDLGANVDVDAIAQLGRFITNNPSGQAANDIFAIR